MGEFDPSEEWFDEPPTSARPHEAEPTHTRYPNDFSDAEELFAEALRGAFSFEYDDLPPDYVQTLLEDELRAPTPEGYEQKLTYQVMRRLDLPRRPLFEGHRRRFLGLAPMTWPDLAELRDGEVARRAVNYARRPLAGMLGVLAAVMISVLILASPAFASGIQVLIAGHTGAQETHGYPTNVRPLAPDMNAGAQYTSLLQVQTPISWLGSTYGRYLYQGIRLQQPTRPQWSKGPVVDVRYGVTNAQNGISSLDIREFQIADQDAAVLQVVEDGSATLTSVDGTSAVFVDGGWMRHTLSRAGSALMNNDASAPSATTYIWVSGGRSELMFARGGVIFWLTATDENGVSMATMTQIAQRLEPLNPQMFLTKGFGLGQIGYSLSVSMEPYQMGMEVYRLVPAGASVESGAGAFVAAQQ